MAALGLPSVGQRLGLQLQVEAGVLGGPGGAEGGAAGGNNLEAGPATSLSVAWGRGDSLKHNIERREERVVKLMTQYASQPPCR